MAPILPFWNRDDIFFLQYLYYSTVDFKLVRQFWQNMFIFQTSAIWVHTTCLFLCSVHFLSPLVISGHALIKNKQVYGNLQKCVWYANLRVGRASYANLRIVRISWHVLDSANEKGSFKFNDNKNRAFVCKRWCNWSTQQSYQRAWLNHVYNRLMWPRKRAARSPPLKKACVIRKFERHQNDTSGWL